MVEAVGFVFFRGACSSRCVRSCVLYNCVGVGLTCLFVYMGLVSHLGGAQCLNWIGERHT